MSVCLSYFLFSSLSFCLSVLFFSLSVLFFSLSVLLPIPQSQPICFNQICFSLHLSIFLSHSLSFCLALTFCLTIFLSFLCLFCLSIFRLFLSVFLSDFPSVHVILSVLSLLLYLTCPPPSPSLLS